MTTPYAQDNVDFPAFDGETYGESHSFNEVTGNFRRNIRGRMQVLQGPEMVAEHLIRVLRTPVGDDPLRPEFGIDRKRLLGTTYNEAKQAVIEAIGPGHIPWVARLGLGDIDIEEIPPENPDVKDTRNTRITIRARLADGTITEFAVGFDMLLRTGRTRELSPRQLEEGERSPTWLFGPAYKNSYEYTFLESGFGFNFGFDYGESAEMDAEAETGAETADGDETVVESETKTQTTPGDAGPARTSDSRKQIQLVDSLTQTAVGGAGESQPTSSPARAPRNQPVGADAAAESAPVGVDVLAADETEGNGEGEDTDSESPADTHPPVAERVSDDNDNMNGQGQNQNQNQNQDQNQGQGQGQGSK